MDVGQSGFVDATEVQGDEMYASYDLIIESACLRSEDSFIRFNSVADSGDGLPEGPGGGGDAGSLQQPGPRGRVPHDRHSPRCASAGSSFDNFYCLP